MRRIAIILAAAIVLAIPTTAMAGKRCGVYASDSLGGVVTFKANAWTSCAVARRGGAEVLNETIEAGGRVPRDFPDQVNISNEARGTVTGPYYLRHWRIYRNSDGSFAGFSVHYYGDERQGFDVELLRCASCRKGLPRI